MSLSHIRKICPITADVMKVKLGIKKRKKIYFVKKVKHIVTSI